MKRHHHPQLDGLRTIAVILVFLHHWTPIGHGLGIVGVQLFFVLSGFLITGVLLDMRQSVDSGAQTVAFSVRQFYLRRFLRICPLYYFCLFVFVCLDLFQIRETFLWHSLYLSNVLFFVLGEFHGLFSHFWSLAVEEQFYLFWPWLVLVTPNRVFPLIVLLLISLSPVVRAALYSAGHHNFAQHSTLVFANFDVLGLGALAAWLARNRADLFSRFHTWLASLWPICLGEMVLIRVVSIPWLSTWLDPLAIALVSVWAVLGAATGFGGLLGRCLNHSFVIYFGKISYGLYVWHMFAPESVRTILSALELPHWLGTHVPGLILSFLWTVAVASATWLLLERPINELKSRFPYLRPETKRESALIGAAESY